MKLTSPAFANNQTIPIRYTGEGQDVSPPLEWSFVPADCKGFALFCEDPDAPVMAGKDHPFVHWLIYNIPCNTSSLPEGLPQKGSFDLPLPASQGRNSFGTLGYNGPMPPKGHGVHHYEFTLYALSEDLNIPSGLRKQELLQKINGKILAVTKLIGTYERVAASKPGRKTA
jgi:Raf kinase inhibitor-like YbhB/YbcL family protein